jgi:hypothetical protein
MSMITIEQGLALLNQMNKDPVHKTPVELVAFNLLAGATTLANCRGCVKDCLTDISHMFRYLEEARRAAADKEKEETAKKQSKKGQPEFPGVRPEHTGTAHEFYRIVAGVIASDESAVVGTEAELLKQLALHPYFAMYLLDQNNHDFLTNHVQYEVDGPFTQAELKDKNEELKTEVDEAKEIFNEIRKGCKSNIKPCDDAYAKLQNARQRKADMLRVQSRAMFHCPTCKRKDAAHRTISSGFKGRKSLTSDDPIYQIQGGIHGFYYAFKDGERKCIISGASRTHLIMLDKVIEFPGEYECGNNGNTSSYAG